MTNVATGAMRICKRNTYHEMKNLVIIPATRDESINTRVRQWCTLVNTNVIHHQTIIFLQIISMFDIFV